MARLNHVTPRLNATPRRLQSVSLHDVRDQANAWRGWYKTKRWRELREQILVRDRFTCQQTGIVCTAKHPDPASAVVHHVKPHRGNAALFWDAANLQCVSKAWHDGPGQAAERRGDT